jgi:hypothetical protein
MKLENDKKELELGYKSTKFRISEKFQIKAMWALINLYKDKIGTPVKEIISNARDANRENGKCDSDITINLSKTELTITDSGKGMSPELMENVVTDFGSSTKTGTNDLNGGFGIGLKSPLCRVNQFKINTIIDGIEYKYIVAKNGDDLALNLIEQTNTSKPTGTTVIIPLIQQGYDRDNEIDQFKRAVIRTVLFWDKKPRFNYEIPEITKYQPTDNSYAFLNDNGVVTDTSFYFRQTGTVYAVIDGMYYPVGESLKGLKTDVVITFKTGDIKIHETRERIEPTPEQKYMLLSKLADIQRKITEIGQVKNVEDFLSKREYFSGLKFENNDVSLVNEYVNKLDIRKYKKGRTKNVYCEGFTSIEIGSTVYFTDVNEHINMTARRAKHYVSTTGNSVNIITVKNESLEKLLVYKNVSELPIPEAKKHGKSAPTSINFFICRGSGYTFKNDASIVNLDRQKWLYIDFNAEFTREMVEFTEANGYILVKLSKSNIELVKKYKNIQSYNDYVSNYKLDNDSINYFIKSNLVQCSDKLRSLSTLLKDSDGEIILNHVNYCDSLTYADRKYSFLVSQAQELKAKYFGMIQSKNEKFTQAEKNIEKRFKLLYDAYSKGNEVFTEYVNAVVCYENSTKGRN